MRRSVLAPLNREKQENLSTQKRKKPTPFTFPNISHQASTQPLQIMWTIKNRLSEVFINHWKSMGFLNPVNQLCLSVSNERRQEIYLNN